MDSGCHKLSKNIWFVWSERSYSGDKETMDDGQRTECEDRARILEAEFAKYKKLSKQLNTTTTMNNIKVGRGRQYASRVKSRNP